MEREVGKAAEKKELKQEPGWQAAGRKSKGKGKQVQEAPPPAVPQDPKRMLAVSSPEILMLYNAFNHNGPVAG